MGKLLAQGLEMKEVIDLMRHTTNYPLMKELAGAISEGLLVGETLHRQLAAYPFYKSIGFNDSTREVKGKLGKELMVYSNVCFQVFQKLNESLPLFNHLFYHNCLFNYRCLWGNVAAYLWQYGRSFIMKRNKNTQGLHY